MTDPVCVVPAGDTCGEGVVWHAAERAVYWCDINRFLIHRFDPETKTTRHWFFNEPVTTIGLTDRPGTLIVALGSKVILWQPANDARADFAHPEKNVPAARLNDGRPDPFGALIIGSMFNNVAPNGDGVEIDGPPLGGLYRVTRDGKVETLKSQIGISNTMCWDLVRKRFYTADTLKNEIWSFDYDVATGAIAHEKPFFADFERGSPDGSQIDSAGYVWNARYGGGCIVRISPEGHTDRVIDMPVGNITNCTFGGADLKTLYITTARGGDGPLERLAGGLFSYRVDVPGLPENIFKIDR
ncbi:SMP-30/gluconolactonase/LRE family protein [Kaistia dalseonensis]|uniref:Sugar lactone lactonase YvrE n=1 Tax=Kaistia dalseonensis TaxID=410840 RepID=A0ABU0H872_9HYPH|nr:SMP-30/gluconolactonase/LRE family protein [Kaistia dalseonensis]MCX5495911.1 SMP-30/gluconolactonase/LRE family protein [Kaistia dalseonensis]MDQ0438514.1 sugar lactone lactonase YvrE [Kaistia dalseonensis]